MVRSKASGRRLGPSRVDTDVLNMSFATFQSKWFFSQKDHKLIGMEMTTTENTDPCELYFSNYKKVGDRSLPHTIEVRYGRERYALLNITTFDVK